MWHVGIDLHRQSVVIAAVNDSGEVRPAKRLACATSTEIRAYCEQFQPFRAVIEATRTYRWLHGLLCPIGTMLLAHPLRLRAMVQRRSKTDRLDAMLLADLLRINQIPLAHIPSEKHQMLRDLTRHRSRMAPGQAESKTILRWILARHNVTAPYKYSVRSPRAVLAEPAGLWAGWMANWSVYEPSSPKRNACSNCMGSGPIRLW